MSLPLILLVALLLDALFGEPKWLWSRIPHPAVVMGRAVGWLDRRFNNGVRRKRAGVFAMLGLCFGAGVIGLGISYLPDYGLIQVILLAMLLAQNSLVRHVRDVADALRLSVGDGRLAVGKIVGRDTRDMDRPAISRGAIESAAENLSDGVIAPAFWFLLAGLPGLLIYKITNTADSMIGYKTPRYADFGWAAARLDDVLNWIPARLSALMIAIMHGALGKWRIILRDAPLHRSPNAGWPEAAMATALNITLSGPRSYEGKLREFPHVHPEGRRDLDADDIDAAAMALWRVWGLLLVVVLCIRLGLILFGQ